MSTIRFNAHRRGERQLSIYVLTLRVMKNQSVYLSGRKKAICELLIGSAVCPVKGKCLGKILDAHTHTHHITSNHITSFCIPYSIITPMAGRCPIVVLERINMAWTTAKIQRNDATRRTVMSYEKRNRGNIRHLPTP